MEDNIRVDLKEICDCVAIFVWLRIGSSGRLLWTQQWTFGFHIRGNIKREMGFIKERLPCGMTYLKK